jgi:biotin carboxyl carrier protein
VKYRVTVQGKTFDFDLTDGPEGTLVNGKPAALVPRAGALSVLVRDGGSLAVSVEPGLQESQLVQLPGGRVLECSVEDERARLAKRSNEGGQQGKKGPRTVRSVMPGIIIKVSVEPGAPVAVKDALLVVEAMKMQNEIKAELAGTVTKVHVKQGQSVAANAPLVEIAPGE